MTGYSRTPLAKKLGIKPGFRIKTKNAPPGYENLLTPIPEGVVISKLLRQQIDLWHLFTTNHKELKMQLKTCLDQISQEGMIWVSWPKKSSGLPSEVTEDTIRELALPMGLVVCAVDQVWSALKLVKRKKDRRWSF
jgi:hypothetical protein